MNSFEELLKKEHMGEFILVILMIIYLILGLKTPTFIAKIIDTLIGKIIIVLIVIYLFIRANPILAVIAALVGFDLIRRSSSNTGISSLQSYEPSEKKKMSQFNAYNQFPYTLEQEVVSKMAPIVRSGTSLNKATYKPSLDNLYDAAPINASN